MEATRSFLCTATLLLGASVLAAAPDTVHKVGDRLAGYTPTKNINTRGKLKCETC
jgi:hypothetical protein